MEMNPDKRPEVTGAESEPQKRTSSTPTYVRVLALIGAAAMLTLSIAYAWSIATGGIFRF